VSGGALSISLGENGSVTVVRSRFQRCLAKAEDNAVMAEGGGIAIQNGSAVVRQTCATECSAVQGFFVLAKPQIDPAELSFLSAVNCFSDPRRGWGSVHFFTIPQMISREWNITDCSSVEEGAGLEWGGIPGRQTDSMRFFTLVGLRGWTSVAGLWDSYGNFTYSNFVNLSHTVSVIQIQHASTASFLNCYFSLIEAPVYFNTADSSVMIGDSFFDHDWTPGEANYAVTTLSGIFVGVAFTTFVMENEQTDCYQALPWETWPFCPSTAFAPSRFASSGGIAATNGVSWCRTAGLHASDRLATSAASAASTVPVESGQRAASEAFGESVRRAASEAHSESRRRAKSEAFGESVRRAASEAPVESGQPAATAEFTVSRVLRPTIWQSHNLTVSATARRSDAHQTSATAAPTLFSIPSDLPLPHPPPESSLFGYSILFSGFNSLTQSSELPASLSPLQGVVIALVICGVVLTAGALIALIIRLFVRARTARSSYSASNEEAITRGMIYTVDGAIFNTNTDIANEQTVGELYTGALDPWHGDLAAGLAVVE
jgi:hypothetical protein